MKFLFVHNNFPAQFRYLAEYLARDPRHDVAAIGAAHARELPRVQLIRYPFEEAGYPAVHPFARRFDLEARRAEQVLYALSSLESMDFVPDVIVAHSGWGETLPLRARYPNAHFVAYCEYFYRDTDSDVNFDAEFPSQGVDGLTYLRAKNAVQLLALVDCDVGLSPTPWQRSTYPREFHSKIAVAHEGVDTQVVRPDGSARFRLPNGVTLPAGSEVLTYAARDLEPMRGFHVFMRILPTVLRARPNVHVVIAGAEGVSYGAQAPGGRTWKETLLAEVGRFLDIRRVHFVGSLPYDDYLRLLQITRVHVYLTYPFVLSWSLIDAMSTGCLIVASDTAPVRDVITHGENGILVPFFDLSCLAHTVIEALARPDAGLRLRRAARETAVSRFERSRTLQAQLSVLHLRR